MNKKQVMTNMKKELDVHAKDYEIYKSDEAKREVALIYRDWGAAYNSLLKNSYKNTPVATLFPREIQTYINIRKCENWEY